MVLRRFRLFLTFFFLPIWVQGLVWGQEAAGKSSAKATDPYAFSIRVYRLPADELLTGFVSKERGRLKAPALPPASAGHGELEAFLKRDHEVLKDYLALKGLTLPPGSLACYDPVSETLALRAMAVVHSMVETWTDSLLRESPKHLAWTLNILEAPAPAVRGAMKDAPGLADQTAVYDRLLPQSKLVTTMRGETKSGQRTVSIQGSNLNEAVEYVVADGAKTQFALEMREVGTKLEFDPVIGYDAATIDLNVALEHHPVPTAMRWEPVTTGSAARMEARVPDHATAKVQTSITLLSGTTKLLGVWDLEVATAPERIKGSMQAAFLRMAIVPLLPLVDPRAEQILRERGEAVVPTPKGVRPVADPTLPPGMSVRRFRIPPDFLSAGSAAAPPGAAADPFASGGAVRDEPRFMRQVTAEDILKTQGIPFPEGSSANFLPGTNELVVRNLNANLEQVAMYVESLNRQQPKILGFSVHLVQADAALIRRWESESLTLADHTPTWKAVEEAMAAPGPNQPKIVGSMWLETKSGQRATFENITEHIHSAGVSFVRNPGSIVAAPAPAAAPAPDAPATPPPAVADHAKGGGNHDLEIAHEMTPVGLRMEVDPVMGGDGRTIDFNLALDYDYAPPLKHNVTEPAADGSQRIAAPLTEFRRAKFQTSTTMLSGSTRLLSVWKPSGTPELDGDVLQAVFLRMDVEIVEPVKK